MAYSDFKIKNVLKDFQLSIVEQKELFAASAEHKISELLEILLKEKVPLAVAISTEKARSELIVADVLLEVRRVFKNQISFFSGIDFDVDKGRKLNGRCDFLLGLSPTQFVLTAPVIMIVETKTENLNTGLGQCVAEMYASQIFNEREGKDLKTIYGAITSGNLWRFLKIEGSTVYIDIDEYQITQINKIVGIMCEMIRQKA